MDNPAMTTTSQIPPKKVGTYFMSGGNRAFGGLITSSNFPDLALIVIPLVHLVWLLSKLLVLGFGAVNLTWLSLEG